MNNNLYISGTIGYIYLKNLKNNNNILLLSDNHSSQNYCKDNGKFISDWMETKNSKVLLEEVPLSNNEMLELWSTKHVEKLKILYLNNNKHKNSNIEIDGIDIRPLLVKFSIEIFKLELEIKLEKEYLESIKKITLFEYLKILFSFFDLKHKYFINNLGDIYINLKGELNIHFKKLKDLFFKIKKEFSFQMNENVYNILQKNDTLLDKISYLLSCIMEWYTIAKIYYNNKKGIYKFIIHAGLDHTTNLNELLIKEYEYEKVNSFGEIDINKIKNDDNNCLKIPKSVDSQFGGYYGKYRKYKAKYLSLKRKDI
jgi:hypothetical protein